MAIKRAGVLINTYYDHDVKDDEEDGASRS